MQITCHMAEGEKVGHLEHNAPSLIEAEGGSCHLLVRSRPGLNSGQLIQSSIDLAV
ncbi:hypothetical protein KSF_042440 [Reticulibacter mediterranei]|uniref:Uncharacterized protein n=1 Tax=Reticulibacter mediterranei TaxID=2778369 RepID=A0A8J3IGK3_9CHLR|nr:hypothetical protein KSF_042440 [Reticulibacter mediterranei]